MKKNIIIFIFLAGLLLIASFGVYLAKNQPKSWLYKHGSVVLDSTVFNALVSDTDNLREKGLSGFSELKDKEIMLFIFPNEGNWGFWMKDMEFAIDIIWLDSDFKVVSIEKNVTPDTYPKSFFPKAPARYVVEAKAGTADKINLKLGGKGAFLFR